MEKNDNKRQIARTLFVQGGMTQKEIASKLEVTDYLSVGEKRPLGRTKEKCDVR